MEKMENMSIKIENKMFAICKLNENVSELEEEIKFLKNENKRIEDLENMMMSMQQKLAILIEENSSLNKKYSKLKEEVKENTARSINKRIRSYSMKHNPKSPTPFIPTKLE